MALAAPPLGGQPMLSYLRYNASLTRKWFKEALSVDRDEEYLVAMEAMDSPDNIRPLREIGQLVADGTMHSEHLPPAFDASVHVN